MPSLSLHQLHVRYGRREVIHDLNAPRIEAGKVTALLGPNGSGKSTLLKAVAGLASADGRIEFDGHALRRQNGPSRQVAYLPQTLPPAVRLRVLESVLVARQATATGLGQSGREQDVLALLERLGIAHLALCFLDQLSGGQRQLVGIAQALVREPAILLLDEPLSALDLNHQFHVMELLRQETRRRGMVSVVVLHDINVALRHTDHVLVLQAGRLVADGVPAAVVTPAILAEVYGVQGRVEACSHGQAMVMVDGLVAAPV